MRPRSVDREDSDGSRTVIMGEREKRLEMRVLRRV